MVILVEPQRVAQAGPRPVGRLRDLPEHRCVLGEVEVLEEVPDDARHGDLPLRAA